MMNKTLLHTLVAIGIMSTLSIATLTNVYAENACRRDCQAPTMGVFDNGKRIVSGGLTINGQTFDVNDELQTIPTQVSNTGETITVRLLVYENTGVNNLAHVTLGIGDYPDHNHESEKVSISWDQKFDGTKSFSVSDSKGLLKGVNVVATPLDTFTTALDFSFSATQPLDGSIKVDMWDGNRSDRTNYFTNAISVKQ